MFTQPQNVFLGDNVRIDPFSLITCKLRTVNNVQITSLFNVRWKRPMGNYG